jgi:peroxiredoxin
MPALEGLLPVARCACLLRPWSAHGDADQIVPLGVSGQRSHKMIKGSRLEVVQGAPHGFAATHAQQLNTLMLDFLKG